MTQATFDPITGILQDSREFRALAVGDTFDWVSPNRIMNSFYLRCIKTGTRTYTDENGIKHRVGSIRATVYNVITAERLMVAAHRAGCDYAHETDSSHTGAQRHQLARPWSQGAFMAGYLQETKRIAGKVQS